MLDILSSQPRITNLVPFEFIDLLGALGRLPMSGKRKKLPTKRGRASENPTPNYDVTRFVNEGAVDRFDTICKNRSFIKEKGFHHPDDFFPQNYCGQGMAGTLPTTSSSCDECGARILRQSRLPCRQES